MGHLDEESMALDVDRAVNGIGGFVPTGYTMHDVDAMDPHEQQNGPSGKMCSLSYLCENCRVR